MAAGLNIRIDVWRMDTGFDDIVGGASITGSLIYTQIQARMQANPAQQLLLQQGLEVDKTFNLVIQPGTLDIQERDEIVVSEPFDHPYHNKYFRVRSVSYSDLNPRDPRNYMILVVSRSLQAHENQ
jgi:hypothetical protein